MNKIVDIHNHLDTLSPIFRYRNKIQGHLLKMEDHIKEGTQCLINLAFYVQGYENFEDLIKLIQETRKKASLLGDRVQIIKNSKDLDKEFSLGLIFHVESGRTLKNYKKELPILRSEGVRGIIPVHFKDNHLGNSCDDIWRRIGLKKQDRGLSQKGKEFTKICNDLGFWLDLSHSSEKMGEDLLEYGEKVMISHVGVRELRNLKRNKPLSILKEIAKKNGLIGVIPWAHLIGNQKESFQETVSYLVKNELEDSLSFGSDFGAPIKTAKHLKSIFDLSREIKSIPFDPEKMRWKNPWAFFKRVLP